MRRWDDHPSTSGLMFRARLDPAQIGYVSNLVEAHEGLAVIRTKDEALGIVEFWISPRMQPEFEDFLDGLRRELAVTVGPAAPIDMSELEKEQ